MGPYPILMVYMKKDPKLSERSGSKNFTIFHALELLILFIGIWVGWIVYTQTERIDTAVANVRTFDNQVSQILSSVMLADVNFTNLLGGNSTISMQNDVYANLNTADALCHVVTNGGPSGQFKPTSMPGFGQPSDPYLLCSYLQTYRIQIDIRWQAYQNRQPDLGLSNYNKSYTEIVEFLNRYTGITESGMKQTQQTSNTVNLIVSFGVVFIFFVISLLLWITQRSLQQKTRKIEEEIKQRTRLNQEIQSERNLLNTLIDNIPDAIVAKDTQKRYLVVNKAAARWLGATRGEEMIGFTSNEFLEGATAEQTAMDDDIVLSTGKTVVNPKIEMVNRTTHDMEWRSNTKVPLRGTDGQINGLVGISHDITREKKIEDALQKANERLKQNIASLEQSTHDQERLNKMIDLLQACQDTEEACLVIADQLIKFFPEDSGSIYLVNSSRNLLSRGVSWGAPIGDPAYFTPDDCWGMRRGRLHIVEENFSSNLETSHSLICRHIIPPADPTDYLCLPLVAQGEALGLLHLRHTISPDEAAKKTAPWYDQVKRQRINTIVDSISLVLANLVLTASLRQQSIRDPLTGMFNRRYMEETLEREIMRAARNQEPLGVIMLDIDHFKTFNDTYGHQAGDAVFRSLGVFFGAHIRGEDVACRYGGEEFLLLLPGSSLENTRKRAEELREKVHFLDVTYESKLLPQITLSFGVSAYPQHGETADELIQNADQALYRAKAEGRDRVIIAE